ncbi:hypothetical protein KSC_079450 [Ktedonobacter sp. SOSP1-52]|uniref:protein kinase domain-containing protein n=1 Tax=Ktedonobacter sp. SOSP1-52 TaxID=2778366 RepID=UPI001914DD87|nr:protein kinase [Ktedonobacter sp. SOSP1-52]GHO69053.1 hypothetical protein KSC_079450 [Ktedonobacter sp. SOSP1-52]
MVESLTNARLAGTTVGNYQLKQVLQEHPWGPVFLAHNREGRSVMLRLLDFESAANPARVSLPPENHMIYLGRFQQEASQVAKLEHQHILPLLDYGNFQGMPFLVYPYVSLVPLRTLLARNVPSDLRIVGQYLEQIVSALEYAHEHAVLHRNLSTNNIFLHNNRHLLLGEFGLLRIRELSLAIRSEKHTFEGDSESSAPEQLLGRSVGAYTDIYALGAIIFRLLTGQPPFQGRSRNEVMRQHLYAEVPSLSAWLSEPPEGLEALLLKAMAKEPQMRYRHPGEVLQAYYQVVAPERLPAVAALMQNTSQAASNHSLGRDANEIDTEHGRAQRHASRPVTPAGEGVPHKQISRRTLFAVGGGTAAAVTIAALGVNMLSAHVIHPTAPMPGTKPQAGQPKATSTQPPRAQNKPTQAAQPTQAPKPMNGKVLAHTGDIPINQAITFTLPDQKNPGVLIHLPNTKFVAFDSTCTHQGCAVHYDQGSKHLVCPCHSAVFDPANNASVLQGPAMTPLKKVQIMVNADGTIAMA